MVAIAGPGWKLAPSLDLFVDEADMLFPGRDHRSDGSIGDQAHASRQSDHNPRDGWVHAVDLDEDLAPGLDLDLVAERMRLSRDPRIAYVIYEGRVFYSYRWNGVDPWTWQRYSGPNAHLSHLHLSLLRTAAARNDLRPWYFAGAHKPTHRPPPPPPSAKEPDVLDQIVYYLNPDGQSTHAYRVHGIHGKYLGPGEDALELVVKLGLPQANTRKTAFGPAWQGNVILVDGPCRNVA